MDNSTTDSNEKALAEMDVMTENVIEQNIKHIDLDSLDSKKVIAENLLLEPSQDRVEIYADGHSNEHIRDIEVAHLTEETSAEVLAALKKEGIEVNSWSRGYDSDVDAITKVGFQQEALDKIDVR